MADHDHEQQQQEPEPQQQSVPQKLPRPESTIAQNFAAELDSMFALSSADPAVDHLSQKVQEKKQTVTSGEQTLQQLEAKLRETEQRLARVSRGNSPARQALSANAENKQVGDGAARPSPLAQKPIYPNSRPQTGERPLTGQRADTTNRLTGGMPGALPPTPSQQHNGSSEYVMVDHDGQQAQRGYG